jgi:hypothetical protein
MNNSKKIVELEENADGSYSAPLVPEKTNLPAVVTVANAAVDADYQKARDNLHDAIDIGRKAFEEISEIATQSQMPESYEVVASMLNSIVKANKTLIDIAKTKLEIDTKTPEAEQESGVINNNLIISSADLAKLLKGID